MKKFLSYGKQWIDNDDIEAVVSALKSDYLTQGPKVEQFENAICEFTGAKFCVSVANGTAALHLAVAALEIKSEMEGITSPNSFAASSNCLIYNNLKPIFADIDINTYNIDIDEIVKRISKKTSVIIPVHFAGQAVDVRSIRNQIKSKNIFIIEDAAHSIGSRYEDGSRVGCCKYSDMTIFSFHPVKTITTGEGGAITTNDELLYNKLKKLRSHGITREVSELYNNPGPWYYEMQGLGYNYRLTDFQAALGISQLKKLNSFITRRREIYEYYNKEFSGISWIKKPYEINIGDAAFHLYVLWINFATLSKSRKEVMNLLRTKNIGTQVHYVPIHLHPYYQQEFGYKKGDYPIVEEYYEHALSIPLHPGLTNDDLKYIAENIKILGEAN